ncbi:MAG: hypothetical protein JRE64_13840 [Deltaproteobacteria bacterium]|nr:hypothetical protein [Deltaproteobacteria bacterium]
MKNTFKGFLSCSFSKEDKWLKEFFEKYIKSLGFQLIVYDFQEPATIPNGIKEQIQMCDCLIALVTRRFKVENSDKYVCPAWLSTEMAWANSYGIPTATLVEEGVSLEGFPKIERYDTFNRDNLINNLPKITKYLQNLRDFLIEHDIGSLVPSPILMRNFIDSISEIRSEGESLFGSNVIMTALSDNLKFCYHSTTLETKCLGQSVKSKKFEFVVLDKPEHIEVTHAIDRNDDDVFRWRIFFEPPLAEGETVKYYYKRISRNNKSYTLEEAEEKMKAPGFPFSEPAAFTDWSIIYPTERLRLEVSFPEGYIIKSPRFLVTLDRSGNVSEPEMKRLQENKFFEIRKVLDKTRLVLDVQRPLWGYRYWVLWTPPPSRRVVYGGGAEDEE